MRINSIVLIFLCLYGSADGQKNLSTSPRHSQYVYIYRISDAEALKIYRSVADTTVTRYLHTLVDSVPYGAAEDNHLSPGNYLRVTAEGNTLYCSLHTVGELRYDLLNDGKGFAIALRTKKGEPVPDARVRMGGHTVNYDGATRSYRLAHRRRGGHLQVMYHGVLSYYTVKGIERRQWRRRGRRPVKQEFVYFLVFGKPKYKPGDTLRGKAFIQDRKGRPVSRPLALRLSDRDNDVDTVLGVITPYRPGGYAFSIPLTDTLDLLLDKDYEVSLEEPGKTNRPVPKDDDDEDRPKRKALARQTFHFEEYELGSISLYARADKKTNGPGDPLAIYLRATDENDMTLPDAGIQVRVLSDGNGYAWKNGHVYLPDTLWQWSQPLDPVGETKILLPDSVFPAVSFSYRAECVLLNSSNEYKEQTLYQTYEGDSVRVVFHARGDSLFVDRRVGGSSRPGRGLLFSFDREKDTLGVFPLTFPAAVRVDPVCAMYRALSLPDSVEDDFLPGEREGIKSGLTCITDRTWDSIHIEVLNPRRLPFRWIIFCGNSVLQRGYGDSLSYHAAVHSPKNYFVLLQYSWAGKMEHEEYGLQFGRRQLRVDIHAPAMVFPGAQTDVTIDVKDAMGMPVVDADVTAYSFTGKFRDAQRPQVPYFSKQYPWLRHAANFRGVDPLSRVKHTALDWQRWRREMGLDTSEYYKFLHPAPVYVNTEPAAEGVTQVAPFVTYRGETMPAALLYIDERPVYFDQANLLSRYSFPVAPGRHALRMRIAGRQIWVDSVVAADGKKTFVNINADDPGPGVRVQRMPDTLTSREQGLWSSYMIRLEGGVTGEFTTLTQDGRFYLPNHRYGTSSSYAWPGENSYLAGPFLQQPAVMHVKGAFDQEFFPEGNYLYRIEKGLIRQRQFAGRPLFPSFLRRQDLRFSLPDQALTEKETDSLWEDYQDQRSAGQDLFINDPLRASDNGGLIIATDPVFIRKIFLFRSDDPAFMRIYKGAGRNFRALQPGFYRLVFLLKGDNYWLMDSIEVRPNGLNYYRVRQLPLLVRDSFSIRISRIMRDLEQQQVTYTTDRRLEGVLQSFNDRWLDTARFHNRGYGTVTNEKGDPLRGVTVMIKGTRRGVSTDSSGSFYLVLPDRGTLTFATVGYTMQELPIRPGGPYLVKLTPASLFLQDVVVTGYGVSKKRSLTGSVTYTDNMLMGRAAGITIRGTGSVSGVPGPLIIVDGLPFSGQMNELDQSRIESMNVLKAADAIAVYGQAAAGGVIVITTRKAPDRDAVQFPDGGAGIVNLRRHFRDNAFWQPRLRTDENGQTSFRVHFPDDITNWKVFALAMAAHRQTGSAEREIRSFKALSANLAVPAFAVSGDSLEVIGKIMHYLPDSVRVERSFRVDSLAPLKTVLSLRHSYIDRFFLRAPDWKKAGDSLCVEYSLIKQDGYSDGERRIIPLYPTGVKETSGGFAALDNADTTFTFSFPADKGPVTVYAEASLLPVLEEEIEHVRHYEYFCNEQLASKLRVLLQKRRIDSLLQRVFTGEKDIREIAGRLMKTRRGDGLWGWFKDGEPLLWISLHVTEALLAAEKAGYAVLPDKQRLIDYLVYSLESSRAYDRITGIRLLQTLGAHVDYRRYIDTAERALRTEASKWHTAPGLYQELELLTLRQEAGLSPDLSPILARRQSTLFGNYFWGEENRQLFDNAFVNTLLVYRLLKKAGGYEAMLKKMRGYFLEKRKSGYWKNTYESCLVLEAILPDVLKEDPANHPSSLTLGEGVPVTAWPYRGKWEAAPVMKVHKTGSLPIYFTAYQQYWNTAPAAVSGEFEVHTHFEEDGSPVGTLHAGSPVHLITGVSVKADADYIMVEIPIPAGCSYLEKGGSWYGGTEVHREYFKNKVSIFCTSLKAGKYTFDIRLMPRFTGLYHLNPARAEMMYFPVFYGREGMKEVAIGAGDLKNR